MRISCSLVFILIALFSVPYLVNTTAAAVAAANAEPAYQGRFFLFYFFIFLNQFFSIVLLLCPSNALPYP